MISKVIQLITDNTWWGMFGKSRIEFAPGIANNAIQIYNFEYIRKSPSETDISILPETNIFFRY